MVRDSPAEPGMFHPFLIEEPCSGEGGHQRERAVDTAGRAGAEEEAPGAVVAPSGGYWGRGCPPCWYRAPRGPEAPNGLAHPLEVPPESTFPEPFLPLGDLTGLGSATAPGTRGPSVVLSEALWTGGSWERNRPGARPYPRPRGRRTQRLRCWARAPDVQAAPSGIRYRKKVDCIIFIV